MPKGPIGPYRSERQGDKANVFLTDSEVHTFTLSRNIPHTALPVRHKVSVGPIYFCEPIPLKIVCAVRG